LTSTPERGFEVPFCQLLISEGHRIVHIDSHSQQEEGKDILTLDPDGQLCGYQLKRGNINVSRWRNEVKGELDELVELPVHLPAFVGQLCKPHLVITGAMNQPTQSRLRGFNESAAQRGFQCVMLSDRHDLLDRFRKCQDVVLPSDPADFRSFLDLMFANGASFIQREAFAAFLESVLPDEARRLRPGEARRLITASLIMAAYAMASHIRSRNYLAEAEGWTLSATRVARAASKFRIARKHWEESLRLACDAAAQAIHRLADEALQHESLVEGNILGDGGAVWRARVTVLCGVVAASHLLRRLEGVVVDDESSAIEFIMKHRKHLFLWGESAAPYFLAMFWYMGTRPRFDIEGENLLAFGYIRNLALANTHRRVEIGIPNPYYTVEDCLEQQLRLRPDRFGLDSFRHVSYTVLPAVHLLVRAMRRQALSMVWPEVVDLGHYCMTMADKHEYLRFRAESATWSSTHLPSPTSWSWLRGQQAAAIDTADQFLPAPFTHDARLPLLFLLCHPHRITTEYVLWLDKQLTR